MSETHRSASTVGLLTLREVRSYLRSSHGRGLALFIGTAYALGSMLLGGMLILARYTGGYSITILWGNALGLQPWDYPGVLIEAPWGFLELPFFATVSMVLVAAGVGLGMAVALLLTFSLLRSRRAAAGRPVAAGTVAGLTPAMIALVTLGACCSTTAAATAGIGLVAQASGSTTSNLLLNNWFLGVFQIVVVYVALIAQELLLRVYGRLFAADDPAFAHQPANLPPVSGRTLVAGALRIGLAAAGVTWVLAVLADWTTVNPGNASLALWFNWVVEHWLIGGTAVLVALSPQVAMEIERAIARAAGGPFVRGLLLLGAYTLGGWVPSPLAGAGIEGFGNQVLGALGFSSSMGAVSPAIPWSGALAFEWGFQYLLLAIFVGTLAVYPTRVLDWLTGPTVPAESESSSDPEARRSSTSATVTR